MQTYYGSTTRVRTIPIESMYSSSGMFPEDALYTPLLAFLTPCFILEAVARLATALGGDGVPTWEQQRMAAS